MIDDLYYIDNKIILCDKNFKIIFNNLKDINKVNQVLEEAKKRIEHLENREDKSSNITIKTLNYYNSLFFLIEIKENKMKLLNNIFIDQFTGLFNRNLWEYLVKNRFKCCSLCLIDIDNLKEINDKYGHLKGDRVINEVSKKLIMFFNMKSDIVIKYGGDEFIILTDKKENEIKRSLVKIKNELINSLDCEVDFSFGISKVYEDLHIAFNEADKIMYRYKKRKYNKKFCRKEKILEEIEKLRDKLNSIMKSNYLENYSEVLKLSNELDILINKYIS